MITPTTGYITDPNNPNGVIRDPNVATGQGGVPVGATVPSIAYGAVNSIPVDTLSSPVAPAVIPTPKVDTTNYSNLLNQAQTQGLEIKKQVDAFAAEQAAQKTAQDSTTPPAQPAWYDNIIKQLTNRDPRQNSSDVYATDYANSGVDEATKARTQTLQDINLLNAELQGLSDKATGKNLSLENSGGAITAGGVQRSEQANIRETAIQALPLQAQILAKQAILTSNDANLKLAQDKLNTVFKLHMDDINNKYDDATALFKSLYSVASDARKEQLDAKRVADDRAFQTQRDNVSTGQSWAKIAGDANQFDIAAKITSLDPKSATYQSDLGKLTSQITGSSLDKQYKQLQIQKLQQDINGTTPGQNVVVNGQSVPSILQPYLQTSYDGIQYVDLSSLTPSEKSKYALTATNAGIKPILDAGTAGKLNAISVSKQNLSSIGTSVSSLLNNTDNPSVQGFSNSISSFLGNADIKSFNAWRTAVINNVQALAGGQGSGLRINQAEIDTALQNDLPVLTGANADNLATAQAKIAKLNTQLDTWTKQILGGGNVKSSTSNISASVPPIGTVIQSGGKTYHVIDAQGNLQEI